MGLETATYLNGLTPAWPLAGDRKNQGDDHLRLIKSVLQATFPGASKPFYFPTAEAISGTQTLDATDMNNSQYVDTTAGNVAITLPTLGASDKGWTVDIVKVSADANAAIVSPASGTILTHVGAVATVRVGVFCEPATFRWTGTGWHCYKPGAAVGSTYEFDNVVPWGYLELDGSAYSNTAFAELFAYLGSSTLKDKNGRVSAGRDATSVRLSATYFGGNSSVVGATGGLESHPLSSAEMPSHDHGTTTSNQTANHQHSSGTAVLIATTAPSSTGGGAFGITCIGTLGGSTSSENANHQHVITASGGSGSHKNVQPTIIVRKCIRAC